MPQPKPTEYDAASTVEVIAKSVAELVIERLDRYAAARLGQKYLSVKEIAERYGIGTRTAEKLIRDPLFPRPIKVRGQRRWSIIGVEAYEAILARGSTRGGTAR